MNFISTFDELNKLYEEATKVVRKKADDLFAVMNGDQQVFAGTKEECENWLKDKTGPNASRFKIVQGADIVVKEALVEAAEEEPEIVEDEIEIIDDEEPVEEVPAEEPVAEEEPKQTIIECSKCGALVIVAEVEVDEESDLVNVKDKCKFCEEKEGYKIVGSVVPYEVVEEEPIEEAFDAFKKPVEWGKLKDTHTLQVVDFKSVKKGDLVISDVVSPDQVEDTDIAEYVAKVTIQGSDVSIKLGGGQGSLDVDATDKCCKVVPNKATKPVEEELAEDEPIEEDIADWYRKTFDRPASISTQQAWEDELNGEMGEISDKRRKHLEKKFQQQRDWEARHPDKEVKY